MIFKERLSAPDPADTAYINTEFGGKNRAIAINKKTGFVLPNCCGEVHGRWIECGGKDNLCIGNAHSYYTYSKDGHARSNQPHLGAIACWSGGAKGFGHVAFVEEVGCDKKGSYIIVSNSSSSSKKIFFTKKLYGPEYKYASRFKLQGFILGEYNEREYLIYKIVQGDTLSGIAKKYKTTIKTLLADNPYIKDPNKIYVGKTLKIRR